MKINKVTNIKCVGSLKNKQRSMTIRDSFIKDQLRKSPRDYSDPSRKKKSYFEVTPSQRPSNRIEILNNNHKRSIVKTECSQERSIGTPQPDDLCSELAKVIEMLKDWKDKNNGINVAINTLYKIKHKYNFQKLTTTAAKKTLAKSNKIVEKWENEMDPEFEDIFETKISNDYLSKTCWHRWRTKGSTTDYSASEEESMRLKIKLLQDNLESLQAAKKDLQDTASKLNGEVMYYKEINYNFVKEISELNAINKTFLELFRSKMKREYENLITIKNITNLGNKPTDHRRALSEYSRAFDKTRPFDFDSRNEGVVPNNKAKELLNWEPLSAVARWLAMDLIIDSPLKNPNIQISKSSSKLTSFSMYKNNAVRKTGYKKVVEDSFSNSDSMKVDDSSVEKGQIPKMNIINDMMDKSHSRGPIHLVFDLI